MKANLLQLFLLSVFVLLTASCGDNSELGRMPVNNYVDKFTTGIIGRDEAIEVVLCDAVPPEYQTPQYLAEAFSISPRVDGKLSVTDDHILTFRPTQLLEPGTRYTITWRIDHFFKTDRQNKKFKFRVRTMTPDVSLKLTEFNVNPHTTNDTVYEWKCTLLLSDLADSATVHNLLDFSLPVDIRWEHATLARAYDFTLSLRKPLAERGELVVTSRAFEGYPKKTLARLDVPAKGDFDLYDITPGSEGRDYLCLSFTRNLDPRQDVRGLITVDPGKDASFSIEDNKVYVWFEEKGGKARTVRVRDGIRSLFGDRRLVCDKSRPEHYRRTLTFENNYPDLQFVGEGGIVPSSDEMLIPFTATYLRGVIVRVVRVYENNMGQFLQFNNLDTDVEMAAVGELLCRKLLFLDEQGNYDLLGKNVFALDLKKLIEPEPGALYHVILSYNYELSAYPIEGAVKKTKKQLYEESLDLEVQEKAAYDDGSRYCWFSDQSWDGYRWDERNNPASPSYYVNRQVSKNVLHSDLGLIAKRGDRGKMLVAVNNIKTGKPMGDVEVAVYNFQNQLIEKKTTWDNGTVEFLPREREPYYIIARKDEQRGYLRLAKSDALSMSAFDVGGEQVVNGTKGFLYTDRGVYNPGDTIFLSFILNHLYDDLPKQHPVTLDLYNPAGQLTWHKTLATNDGGIYVFRPVTASDAMTGVWRGVVTVGGVTFDKRIRIETIKPNRLSIDLTFAGKLLSRDAETEASLHAQWLTGATATNLKYDITATFSSVPTEFKGYEGYAFDDPTRTFAPTDVLFQKGRLDDKGNATIKQRLAVGAAAPGMLKTQFLTKVYEDGGEPSYSSTVIGYSPFRSYVGIHSPEKEGEPLLTGADHSFDLATVMANGTAAANRTVKVQMYRVEWYWWWNADLSAVANYVSSSYYQPVRQAEVITNARGRGRFTVNMPDSEWGAYYIRVSDSESGHVSGLLAYFDNADWYDRNPNVDNQATLLQITTDKESYEPGEEVRVTFPSTAKSHALVAVEASGGILDHHMIECTDRQTTFTFEATAPMQPNAYVGVTLINPYDDTRSDLPLRLYGVVPVTVRAANSKLEPVIKAPAEIKPLSRCHITVSEKSGYPMTFTLAVVDEGLLELTNFKTPSPWDAFFAKEALGIRTWDLYKYVLGAYGGPIERIFSIGGDDALTRGPKAVENRFKPVVRFIGPITLPRGGQKTISFTMPEYVGKVRCMVVAANKYQYGHADCDVVVSQPLMALGSIPASLAPDDEMLLPVTLFAMKDGMGPISVTLKASRQLDIVGPATQTVEIPQAGSKVAWFKLKAKSKAGAVQVVATATCGSEKAIWTGESAVNSPMKRVVRANELVLGPGESCVAALMPFGLEGSNYGVLKVSGVKIPHINNINNIMSIEPTDGLGQLMAKAFALMTLPRIVDYTPERLEKMEAQLRLINTRLQSYRVPGGGFALWPGGTSVNAWNTIYAYLYLINAEKSGYVLPHEILRTTRAYLGRIAREWTPQQSPTLAQEEIHQAFRLFALAYDGFPERGAMNRLRQIKDLPATARLFLASAYAFENQTIAREQVEIAGQMPIKPFLTPGFYDAVRLQTYELVGYQKQALDVIRSMSADQWTNVRPNTFEGAFSLIGLVYYYIDYPPIKNINFDLAINGRTEHIDIDKMSWVMRRDTLTRPVKALITNRTGGTLYVDTSVSGIPTEHDDAATANGFSVKATFTTLGGVPVNEKKLAQGDNFIYRVTVTNNSGVEVRDIVVEQPVASGWTIVNTRLLNDNSRYPAGVTYQDIRDVRLTSYIASIAPNQSITIPISLTASYAGTYYLTGASAYNIYTTQFSGSTAGETVVVERD